MRKKIKFVLGLALGIFILSIHTQCTKQDETAKVTFYLTDAPAAYQQVNIDLQAIKIIADSDSSETTLELERVGIYNLLDFSNGLDTVLASFELPVGKISQIRLILGDNNSLVVDDKTFDLKVPSGSESGLKLKVNETIEAGGDYHLVMDFDASRSVKENGNGKYILKPVIRMFSKTESGAIKGSVTPAEARPFVYAINGTDTIGTIANEAGEFKLTGIKEGVYTLSFVPQNGGSIFEMKEVAVKKGETLKVGNITLP